MKKKVILTLTGSYEQGMSASLRILEEVGASVQETLRVFGQLPPALNLSQIFQKWQISYRRQINSPLRMKFINAQVTQVSCEELSTQLCFEFNKWLNSKHEKWQKIRDQLQQNLSKADDILLIIETEDWRVQQLPWQLWKLITDDYPHAEIALSAPDYQLPAVTSVANNKVKILAILGNAQGIDVGADRAMLEGLPNTEICFLIEPKRQELTDKLWSFGWDILFFAGHSISGANGSGGIIYLNQNEEPLTINQLKYGLLKAIKNGLKLAIFNSCDGLGIARDLAELNIPQMIVMREPVPDFVAQEFLKYFLQYFASGESFYLAVRLAREKLQGLEAQFPCASWLPVIFQNSAQMPFSWLELKSGKHQHLTLKSKLRLRKVLLISVLATSLIMGARYLGVFESLELQAFDQLIRLRPQEQPEKRLLVVAVTEDDLHLPQQRQRKGSLSDLALKQLLQKLEQSKPAAIGLDIYRDFPVDSKQKGLAARMRHNKSLIAVCKVSSPDDPGVAPPPEISPERLGFSDFMPDSDGILRRQIVSMGSDPASPCTTPYAFSTQLAFSYLVAKGIIPKYTANEVLQLDSTLIKPWSSHTGGYQAADLSGYQVMLNYRSSNETPKNIAPIVTLEQVLNNKVNPKAIKDRIVLIGTVANSYQDYWLSPYSRTQKSTQELSGVIVQAQMTSQILSAVLDKRQLLWASPFWGDIIWVLSLSLAGGVLAMQLKSPLSLLLAISGAEVCLYALSYGLLLHNGYWVPLLPSAFALVATSAIYVAYTDFPAKRQQSTEL